jgi:hypothetical protein
MGSLHKVNSFIIRCGYGLWAGRPRFESQQGQYFLFSRVSRPALGPTQPHIQWALWASAPQDKAVGA